MFKIIGSIVGFMLSTAAFYLFGFDFDERGSVMGFWFLISAAFGALCGSVGSNYDK